MSYKETSVQDPNLIGTPADVFAGYYNINIPRGFPRATSKTLAEFQKKYPSLFKEDGKWSVTKHRKKFMDWLVLYREQ